MGIKQLWETHVLPHAIEVALADRVTGGWRAKTCGTVEGDVLEVGFGSGRNLPYYGDGVRRILAVEPSDKAWAMAAERIAEFGRPVERIGLDGAVLELDDASVDAVVSTWTLCTIPDVDAALLEIRRVLRPGGALHLVEHSRSPSRVVSGIQNAMQPVWGVVSGGCHVNRNIGPLLDAAGLHREGWKERYAVAGPLRPFGWFVTGRGVRPELDGGA